MKKLSLIAAALLALSSPAFAASTTDSFDITMTFTANCRVKTAALDVAVSYTGVTDAGSTFNRSTVFECSRGLTPSFSFNDNAADMTSNGSKALAVALAAQGVLAGVRYTIAGTTSRSTTGTAAAAGAGGAGGTNGTADEYTVAMTVNFPASQAGDPLDTNTTHARVLTISY